MTVIAKNPSRIPRRKHAPLTSLLICFAISTIVISYRVSSADLDTLQKAKSEGVVRIGYANEAPYAYLDIVSGHVTGESPEIARIILSRMGIHHIESTLTEFGSLIPGLQAGRFDIIAAGMYILPERCQQISFSDPSYSTGEALIVRKGNPRHLHGYADIMHQSATRLGVVAGTVEAQYATDAGIHSGQILIFPDNPSGVEGLMAGRIDAFAASEPTARNLTIKATTDSVELAHPLEPLVIHGRLVRGYGAFGFRKADQDFVVAFNHQLHTFIGTPEHQALVRPFGFGARQLPGNATASQLCDGQGT